MIAPMEKLVVAGPKRLARELLAELQRAGVVHIDPLRPEELEAYALSEEERAQLKEWERIAAGAEQAAKLLGLALEPKKPLPGSQAEVAQALEPLLQKASVLAGERERLLEELEFLKLYRGAVEALAELVDGLDQSRWLRVLPVLLEKEELEKALASALDEVLPERYVLAAKPADGVLAAAVVVLKGDADAARATLGKLGLAEFRLPEPYAGLSFSEAKLKIAERSRLAPSELESVEEAIRALVREAREKLMAIWTRARDEIERLKRLEALARGRFSFGLFGWVPVSKKPKVEEALERLRERVVYAFEPVDEHHEADRVPVTLENPAWVKPFETLVTFLNVPKYGTWDPSWVLAAFFPFWFGMIVGDIGYALLFWLLARFLAGYAKRGEPLVLDLFGMKLSPQALDNTVRILKPMVFWTVVFGILYGEFFGNFLEHLGVFYVPGHGEGLFRILIPRTLGTTAGMLILVTILFGVFMVLYGLAIRAWLGWRHRHLRHFWEAVGYLGGLVALIVLAYTFLTGASAPLFTLIMVLGFGLLLVGAVLARMPLMIAELPTQGGHMLSYVRIYAVGVTGAIMANLSTDLGFALAGKLGLIGVLLGLVVGLAVHGLVLALTTIGHVLQPVRLIWVEFFTKFGFYDESGRPYRPFSSVRNNAGA